MSYAQQRILVGVNGIDPKASQSAKADFASVAAISNRRDALLRLTHPTTIKSIQTI